MKKYGLFYLCVFFLCNVLHHSFFPSQRGLYPTTASVKIDRRARPTSTPADAHDQRRRQPTRTTNVDASRHTESTLTPADVHNRG
jgi:hypothetical protein